MTEPARYSLLARRTLLGRRTGAGAHGRKVMGKTLVTVSALGMVAVLVALLQGRYVLAVSGFLMTVGVLEVMFQRALALFHGSAARVAAPGHGMGRPAQRHAAAGE